MNDSNVIDFAECKFTYDLMAQLRLMAQYDDGSQITDHSPYLFEAIDTCVELLDLLQE